MYSKLCSKHTKNALLNDMLSSDIEDVPQSLPQNSKKLTCLKSVKHQVIFLGVLMNVGFSHSQVRHPRLGHRSVLLNLRGPALYLKLI